MRVVSLDPSSTQALAALEALDRVVARSPRCPLPPGLEHIPIVRGPNPWDRVRAHEPDLVLASPDAPPPPPDFRAPVLVNRTRTVEEMLDHVLTVGDRLGLRVRATHAVARLRDALFSAQERVNAYVTGPRVACVLSIDPLAVAGDWVAQVVERAGGSHPLNPTTPPAESGPGGAIGAGAGFLQADRVVPAERVVEFGALEGVDRLLVCARPGADEPGSLEASEALARAIVDHHDFPRRGPVRAVGLADPRALLVPGPGLARVMEWMVGWLEDERVGALAASPVVPLATRPAR